ncbi:MAG: class I SAM-dependent methyltransferase [Desulfobacter sp.]
MINKKGDKKVFDKNWTSRPEAGYLHWTREAPANQIQLAFRCHWHLFQDIIAGRMSGKNVLEVGCGRGSLSAYFADHNYDCTLLDSSKSVLSMAKQIFAFHNLSASFDVGDAMNLPYDNETFDLTFSIGLLEHFKDIDQPVSEQIRVLKKGGIFIGYVVPKYDDNIQKKYQWVNDLLKGMIEAEKETSLPEKERVYRSDEDSSKYVTSLKGLGVKDIHASGVYPLPMISYSTQFPFTLLNDKCEKVLVEKFQKVLDRRQEKTGQNPWLCKEGYGQAFLVWGRK